MLKCKQVQSDVQREPSLRELICIKRAVLRNSVPRRQQSAKDEVDNRLSMISAGLSVTLVDNISLNGSHFIPASFVCCV
jgi:hypothetical protein